MSKTSLKSLLAASAFLASSAAAGVQAQEATIAQVNQYAAEGAAMGQVTSVSQLRDVRPTDWAFQALQSLVERYGCIAGYPDGTFRGNRAMTRYEFAAGLNACLDRVNELIASATADLVTQEDLAVLQRLQEEFQAELATLRGRVDALEARTAELEANQFSTTTTLSGSVIFDVGSVFDGEGDGGFDAEDEVTFGSELNLSLNTSFTGRDLLLVNLNAANIGAYATRFEGGAGVPEIGLFDEADTGNTFVIDDLWYNFPIGQASVFVGTVGLEADEIVPTTASFADASLADYFADGNPLSYNLVEGNSGFGAGAGAGFNYDLGDTFNFSAAFLAAEANAAGNDQGLTGGNNTAFTQLTFTPGDRLTIAGTYNRAYNSSGGPSQAGGIVGVTGGNIGVAGESYTVDAFGINAGYALSSNITIDGWAGWGLVDSNDSDSEATLFNWAVNLGFPDLFREGNMGGISVGGFTNVIDEEGDAFNETDEAPFLAQAFYRLQLSDNISIQPGVIFVTNPAGDDDNDNVWVGNLKTQFNF